MAVSLAPLPGCLLGWIIIRCPWSYPLN